MGSPTLQGKVFVFKFFRNRFKCVLVHRSSTPVFLNSSLYWGPLLPYWISNDSKYTLCSRAADCKCGHSTLFILGSSIVQVHLNMTVHKEENQGSTALGTQILKTDQQGPTLAQTGLGTCSRPVAKRQLSWDTCPCLGDSDACGLPGPFTATPSLWMVPSTSETISAKEDMPAPWSTFTFQLPSQAPFFWPHKSLSSLDPGVLTSTLLLGFETIKE